MGGHAKRPRRSGGDRLHPDRWQPATVAGLRGLYSPSPARWPERRPARRRRRSAAVAASERWRRGAHGWTRLVRAGARAASGWPTGRAQFPSASGRTRRRRSRDVAQAGQPEQRQRSAKAMPAQPAPQNAGCVVFIGGSLRTDPAQGDWPTVPIGPAIGPNRPSADQFMGGGSWLIRARATSCSSSTPGLRFAGIQRPTTLPTRPTRRNDAAVSCRLAALVDVDGGLVAVHRRDGAGLAGIGTIQHGHQCRPTVACR